MAKSVKQLLNQMIDYCEDQHNTSSGEILEDIDQLDFHFVRLTVDKLIGDDNRIYDPAEKLQQYYDRHHLSFINLNLKYSDIKDNEYISNILDMTDYSNKNIFYVLSRLFLAKENLDDDNIDGHHELQDMINDLNYIIIELFDTDSQGPRCCWCERQFETDVETELVNTNIGLICETCLRALQSRGESITVYK